jgi:hypothetical protein
MWYLLLPPSLLAIIVAIGLHLRRNKHFPPGPKPTFLLGNLLDVPGGASVPWKVYAEWGKIYGRPI